MSKTVRRYTLVEYFKDEIRDIKGYNFFSNFFDGVDKLNKGKNQYLIGDISMRKNLGFVSYVKYRKLTEPSTLEKIDIMTTSFDRDVIVNELKSNGKLYIAYKANKRIKTLPVIFLEDKKYLDREYVKGEFYKNRKSLEFVNMLLNIRSLELLLRGNEHLYDTLLSLRYKLKNNMDVDTNVVSEIYKIITNKGGKFNYFSFRFLALMVRDFNNEKKEKVEEVEISEEYEQLEIAGVRKLSLSHKTTN